MGMWMLRKILIRSAKGIGPMVYGRAKSPNAEYWDGFRSGLRLAADQTMKEILEDRRRRIEKKEDVA